MRVLHVNAGNMFGGVETIMVTLARFRRLCPEMQSTFAMCFEGRLSRELSEIGVPVRILGAVRASRFWTVLRARKVFRNLLLGERFDVVICHMSWTQAIFGPVVRALGIPLVFYMHGRTQGRHWIERWARWAARPNLVVSVSKDTAQDSAAMYPGVPTTVVYSPCPLEGGEDFGGTRAETRQSMGTPAHSMVIIQVSRMESGKGHYSLLRALGNLKESDRWECWVVGGGQTPEEQAYVAELENLAKSLGLSGRVRFLGERKDVPQLLAAADIFCHPNHASEGFGIVFMEAFFAGLPIITSSIGGGLELVDSSCGVILPPRDVAGLTQSMEKLIHDKAMCLQMGKAGRKKLMQLCDPEKQLHVLLETLSTASQGLALPQ